MRGVPKNAPELPIRRLWKLESHGGNRVILAVGRWTSKMLLAITISVCSLAAFTTIGMMVIAMSNYNPGSWETVVILGGWDSLVYLGIIAIACVFRHSPRTSCIVALGAAAISAFSVLVLYADLQPYFTPPSPTFRVMNCAGPLIQFGLPFLQWPALGMVAGIAYCNSRVHRPNRVRAAIADRT